MDNSPPSVLTCLITTQTFSYPCLSPVHVCCCCGGGGGGGGGVCVCVCV